MLKRCDNRDGSRTFGEQWNMNEVRLLSRDIKLGFMRKAYVLLLVLPFAYAMTKQCRLDIVMLNENGVLNSTCTIVDYWIYSMRGMNIFKFDPVIRFEIPIHWFWFEICASYFNAYYTKKDFDEQGGGVLLVSGNRTAWWFSKAVLCVIKTTAYFLFSIAIIAVLALLNGAKLSPEITYSFLMYKFGFNTVYCNIEKYLVITAFLPWLATCSICLVQNALSLYFGSIVSFISVCVLYIISAYYTVWFLPGNYMMWLRSSFLYEKGISPLTGIIVSIGITIMALILGDLYINNCDILSKENGRN